MKLLPGPCLINGCASGLSQYLCVFQMPAGFMRPFPDNVSSHMEVNNFKKPLIIYFLDKLKLDGAIVAIILWYVNRLVFVPILSILPLETTLSFK